MASHAPNRIQAYPSGGMQEISGGMQEISGGMQEITHKHPNLLALNENRSRKKGDLLTVANGFARNFLIPQGKHLGFSIAKEATKETSLIQGTGTSIDRNLNW